jgi:hypothetical protein
MRREIAKRLTADLSRLGIGVLFVIIAGDEKPISYPE